MKQGYIPEQPKPQKRRAKKPVIIAAMLFVVIAMIIGFGSGDKVNRQKQEMSLQQIFSDNIANSTTDEPGTQTEKLSLQANIADQKTLQLTATPTIMITSAPTLSPVPARSILKKGDTGAEVKALQNRLIELGFLSGAADGDYGNGTRAAVTEFQKANGLDADGVAGNKTLTTLYSDYAKKQVWVWIPSGGGGKYHSNPSCSKMISPQKVTMSEAIKKGFDPCGKCY